MSRSEDTPFDDKDCDDAPLTGALQAIPHDHFMMVVNTNYARYVKRAYGYLKCKSLAEDAVQDGILSAYKKLNTVRDIEALNGWVNRIISNKALDILRKNKRMPDFYADIDDVVSYSSAGILNEPLWAETSTPEQDIMKKENLQRLNQVIEELQDIYRIPLLMKDREDFSVKEISEILGLSESNTKIRIHRARTKVKIKLGECFFPHQSRGQT